MPSLYVNHETGSNANSGLSGFPVRDLQRAINGAADGDTIYVTNTTLANPARFPATVNKDVKIMPVLGDAYVTSAHKLDHGSIVREMSFSTIFTDTVYGGWSDTHGSLLNNIEQLYGTGCLQLTNYSRKYVAYQGRRQRYRVVYKGAPRTRIDGGSSRYLNLLTGEWENALVISQIPYSAEYAEYVSPWFDTDDGAAYAGFMYLYAADPADGYGNTFVQEIVAETEHQWQEDGNGNFVSNYVQYGGTYQSHDVVFKGDLRNGYQDMRVHRYIVAIPIAGDEGKFFYDSVNQKLYYRPLVGETINDLHVEHPISGAAIMASEASPYCYRLIATCGANGFTSGVSGTLVCEQCWEQVSWSGGIKNYSAANIWWIGGGSRQPVASTGNKEYGGGFVSGSGSGDGTGWMRISGATVLLSGDDSFQPADNTQMIIEGCISLFSNSTDIECSFQAGGVNGSLTVNGLSCWGAGMNAFRDQSVATTYAVNLNSCVFIGAGSVDMTWTLGGSATATYNVENVFYGGRSAGGTGSIPAAITNNATQISESPYTDAANGDLTPLPGSVLQGTSGLWGDIGVKIDANGRPYPRIKRDVGGIQSTHAKEHVSNV